MSETQTKTKQPKNVKKILNKIATIFLVVFFVSTLSLSVYFAIMRKQNKPVSIFGHYVCYILTGSMEDTLLVGDIIIIKQTAEENIKEGDIITYQSTTGLLAGNYITHRVINIVEHPNQTVQFITKGDAPNSPTDTEFITYQKVLGVYQKKAVILTFLLSMFSNFIVFFLVAMLPLIILFALQIKNFILALNNPKKNEEEN